MEAIKSTTRNPFVPSTSDMTPRYFAGRQKERQFIDGLIHNKVEAYRKNLIITGFRGIGKSSLLNYLENEAIKANWKVIKIKIETETGENEKALLVLIVGKLRNCLREAGYDEGVIQKAFAEAQSQAKTLEAAATAIAIKSIQMINDNKFLGLIFAFDEAQFLKDSKQTGQYVRTVLLNVLSNIQKAQANMFYVVVGIPTLISLLQESKPNIERAFINAFDLELLSPSESVDLIKETLKYSSDNITFDEELVEYIVKKSNRYPYFLQFFCSELVDSKVLTSHFTKNDLLEIESEVISKLDNVFYGSRVKKLPKSDREYLNATANLEQPFKPKELLEEYNRLHPDNQKLGVTIRQAVLRLVNKGLLFRSPDGYVYTIPLINEFINRTNGQVKEADDEKEELQEKDEAFF